MESRAQASAIRNEPRPVSLVIPTLNGGPRFCEVLEALAVQDVEGGFELLVVDSGSTDGTAEAALAAGAAVERIDKATFNHGRTRNLGIARTHGDVVALLTQDALPMDPGYLRKLVEPFENPRVDGAYARQFPRPDCDPLLAERLRQWSATRNERELKVLAPDAPEKAQRLFTALPPMERYLCCAFDNVASAVRRTTWQRIPFPARRFGEDVAWARAVLLAGGAVAFEPGACVEHSHRIDMRREFKRIYCDHKNLMELFGLYNVPGWRAVWNGWRWQRGFYRRLLGDARITPGERLYWRAYSIPYALLETAAQFLGARSHWKVQESRFWAWLDGRFQRGV